MQNDFLDLEMSEERRTWRSFSASSPRYRGSFSQSARSKTLQQCRMIFQMTRCPKRKVDWPKYHVSLSPIHKGRNCCCNARGFP